MKILEVWTGEQWSKVRAGADGQPRYVSNGGLVGNGMRITRVTDAADENTAPEVVLNEINLDIGGQG